MGCELGGRHPPARKLRWTGRWTGRWTSRRTGFRGPDSVFAAFRNGATGLARRIPPPLWGGTLLYCFPGVSLGRLRRPGFTRGYKPAPRQGATAGAAAGGAAGGGFLRPFGAGHCFPAFHGFRSAGCAGLASPVATNRRPVGARLRVRLRARLQARAAGGAAGAGACITDCLRGDCPRGWGLSPFSVAR